MKKIVFLLAIIISVMSCKKAITKPRSGIFRGTFEMTNTNGDLLITSDGTISLNDASSSYVFNRDTTTLLPYPSSGIYDIIDENNMKFTMTSYREPLFIPHLYLDTIYKYSFDDTRFSLSKTVNDTLYEYKFIRY